MKKNKKYNWALVNSKTGSLLRADNGRRAFFRTRDEARTAKYWGDNFGRYDLNLDEIKVVRRSLID